MGQILSNLRTGPLLSRLHHPVLRATQPEIPKCADFRSFTTLPFALDALRVERDTWKKLLEFKGLA
jgi:hypothetical protein